MKYGIAIVCMFVTAFSAVNAGDAVSYKVDGETCRGYYVSPAEEAPLVLLVHDWNGLTDYEKKRADMLKELGYAVFAADLFGAGNRPTELKDKRQHTGELYKDREKMRALLRGALKTAERQGADVSNAVAMGYCFGGAAVLEFARSGEALKGFATFHGGLGTPEGQDYAKTKGHILIMHGTADNHVSMDDFAKLAKRLEKHGVPHQMITYGGAPHAFTVFGSDSYRADADKKSWRLFKYFLKQRLR